MATTIKQYYLEGLTENSLHELQTYPLDDNNFQNTIITVKETETTEDVESFIEGSGWNPYTGEVPTEIHTETITQFKVVGFDAVINGCRVYGKLPKPQYLGCLVIDDEGSCIEDDCKLDAADMALLIAQHVQGTKCPHPFGKSDLNQWL